MDVCIRERSEIKPIIMNKYIFQFLWKYGIQTLPKNRYIILVIEDVICSSIKPNTDTDKTFPDNCMVFGMQHINEKLFLPLGTVFYFNKTSPEKLALCIKAYINDLKKCELTVIATVSPFKKSLVPVIEHLVGNDINAFVVNECKYSTEEVEDIFHIFDPPSLLKYTRMKFFDAHFVYFHQNKLYFAEMEEIICCFFRNEKGCLNFLKRSFDTIKDAEMMFSRTIGELLENSPCTGTTKKEITYTAPIILFFDKLYRTFVTDSFSSNLIEEWLKAKSTLCSMFAVQYYKLNSLDQATKSCFKNYILQIEERFSKEKKLKHDEFKQNCQRTCDLIHLLWACEYQIDIENFSSENEYNKKEKMITNKCENVNINEISKELSDWKLYADVWEKNDESTTQDTGKPLNLSEKSKQVLEKFVQNGIVRSENLEISNKNDHSSQIKLIKNLDDLITRYSKNKEVYFFNGISNKLLRKSQQSFIIKCDSSPKEDNNNTILQADKEYKKPKISNVMKKLGGIPKGIGEYIHVNKKAITEAKPASAKNKIRNVFFRVPTLLNPDVHFLDNEMKHPLLFKAWIISITSMISLFQVLEKKRYKYIKVDSFNNNALNNFLNFIKIRKNNVKSYDEIEYDKFELLNEHIARMAFDESSSITLY